MDPTSQRAVDEEVESYVPPVAAETGGRGEPAPPAPAKPAQPPQAMFQQMAEFFRQMAGVMPSPPPPQQKSHLEKLRKFGAVDFFGKREDDYVVAENWLNRTGRVLKQLHCTPEQNLEAAVSLLQDDAYQWWDTVSNKVQPEQIIWDFFLSEFKKKYVGSVYLEGRRREFINLRQRQLTVAEYEKEFVRLSRYGREIVPNEVERCKRFEEGLNDNIKIMITALGITDFTKLVEVAIKVEKVRIDRLRRDMDSTSQRAVEEEVESHVPPVAAETGGRGEPAPPAPTEPAQPPQAMFQQMAEFFRQMAGVMPLPPLPQQKSHLEKLRKFGAVDFFGKREDDYVVAENWLNRTGRVLKQLHCTPEQNLEAAVSLLQDDAYQWWDTVSNKVQPEQIIWDFFLSEFKKKYVGSVYLEERRREFINLRQRQLTVAEYENEFVRLSRYGREIVPNEAERCKRFEEGLNDNIKIMITALGITDFTKLVEVVIKVEKVRISKQTRRERQQKRGPGQSSSSLAPEKKFKGPPAQSSGQPQGQGQSQGPRPQFTPRRGQSTPSVGSSPVTVFRGLAPASSACPHCLKWHKGECWRVTGACLRCGSTEHQLRNCPRRTITAAPAQTDRLAPASQRGRKSGKSEIVGPSQRPASEPAERPEAKAPARAYAIRAQEEQDAPDVIRASLGQQKGGGKEKFSSFGN
ncbi:uncharacterized protein LOC110670225 isoform X2 [Hevea brasiliensis]|uniref:uncharacterized protein LOC110670225 isoform X2 n=1 Tax=Hevea brasiliensis TaxID=3981 RepID=UPI0025D1A6BA|nr:uncharacterized protein LOC110670225 isoform X2 [Hevea brasiliensis]